MEFFYFAYQFAGGDIKGLGNAPEGFKIGLLASHLYHCQMGAGNSGKTAEQLLGHTLLLSDLPDRDTHKPVIELHTTTTFFIRIAEIIKKNVYEDRQN